MFVGSPISARFSYLTLLSGQAEKGGAMHLTGGRTRINNAFMGSNQANVAGGAIYLEGPNTRLRYIGVIFKENSSRGTGGAISVANGATVRTFASAYRSNSADTLGGAVYNNGGNIRLADSLFKGNTALVEGDTLYNDGNATALTSNVDCGLIIRNTFCGGKESLVNSGSATSNCRKVGIYNIDPRC